jgi:ubiquinone/menaquinone biosynthesis C-methylase UbiE
MECVLAGGKLQRSRTAFLGETRAAQSVLILGEGNGRFLEAFRRGNASARILCIDSSEQMLLRARYRLLKSGIPLHGITLTVADALNCNLPPGAFDLVVTHFFLDCFPPEQLRPLIGAIANAAQAKAAWLLADFQIPARGMARYRASAIHWLMYMYFRRVTRLAADRLTDPGSHLQAAGFVLNGRAVSDWGLLRSDLWRRGQATSRPSPPSGR